MVTSNYHFHRFSKNWFQKISLLLGMINESCERAGDRSSKPSWDKIEISIGTRESNQKAFNKCSIELQKLQYHIICHVTMAWHMFKMFLYAFTLNSITLARSLFSIRPPYSLRLSCYDTDGQLLVVLQSHQRERWRDNHVNLKLSSQEKVYKDMWHMGLQVLLIGIQLLDVQLD